MKSGKKERKRQKKEDKNFFNENEIPDGQVKHVTSDLAPSEAENLPAIHMRHEAGEGAPRTEEYVPAKQF